MRMRDETLAELVVDLLATGPLTGFEIARALEDDHKVILRGREGTLYVALLQLVRDGYLEVTWERRPDGTRRRWYRLPVLRGLGAGAGSPPLVSG